MLLSFAQTLDQLSKHQKWLIYFLQIIVVYIIVVIIVIVILFYILIIYIIVVVSSQVNKTYLSIMNGILNTLI
jgi:heme/copper-type cytochrome/quinol oxidase subunit 2